MDLVFFIIVQIHSADISAGRFCNLERKPRFSWWSLEYLATFFVIGVEWSRGTLGPVAVFSYCEVIYLSLESRHVQKGREFGRGTLVTCHARTSSCYDTLLASSSNLSSCVGCCQRPSASQASLVKHQIIYSIAKTWFSLIVFTMGIFSMTVALYCCLVPCIFYTPRPF